MKSVTYCVSWIVDRFEDLSPHYAPLLRDHTISPPYSDRDRPNAFLSPFEFCLDPCGTTH
jgi:hypothetical protein